MKDVKKGRQDNWLFNKKLSSAIPCNDIIACYDIFVICYFFNIEVVN